MKIEHDYRRLIKTIRHEEPDRVPPQHPPSHLHRQARCPRRIRRRYILPNRLRVSPTQVERIVHMYLIRIPDQNQVVLGQFFTQRPIPWLWRLRYFWLEKEAVSLSSVPSKTRRFPSGGLPSSAFTFMLHTV